MSSVGKFLLATAGVLICLVPGVQAYPIIFSVGPNGSLPTTDPNAGGIAGTGPVDVRATFTLDTTNQKITIALLNTLAQDTVAPDIIGVPQAISGIEFHLANTGSGYTNTFQTMTVTESGGTYVDINSKTSTALDTTNPSNHWNAAELAPAAAGGTGTAQFPAITSGTMTLCTICYNNSTLTSNPAEMLIPGPDPTQLSTDAYSKANGSMTASGHQPFLLASGDSYTQGPFNGVNAAPVWSVQMPTNSLVTATTITSVTFYFGSLYYEYSVTDNSPITPEPASVLMMLSGLGLVGWIGRKRLSQTRNR